MKKLIFFKLLYLMPFFSFSQIDNLDFDRRESIDVENHPYFESISEDNRLNNNTQTNLNLYTTYNFNRNIGGFNRSQGVINHNFKGAFTQFEAINPLQPNNEVTIVNCTQDVDNLLVSGTNYHNYITIPGVGGAILTVQNRSNGILMKSLNSTNFLHDLVEFNFNSIPPISSSSSGVITSNHFVFITDAVTDNSGNTYAVGTINDNLYNVGHSFMIKLDINYNIVDMRLNITLQSTFERIVYDDADNSIYMVGKGRVGGSGVFNPIIAKYDINASTFDLRAYNRPTPNLMEAFFDIKKDNISQQLVVGVVEGHYDELGLMFFDNNLNLLSHRLWDNPRDTLFSLNNFQGELSVFSNKPNSIYIGSSEIFIRGTGMRDHTANLSSHWFYSNTHYHTDRFLFTPLNATYSSGRVHEHSSNPLFQTMNGMHPWFPKKMNNINTEMITFSDMKYITPLLPNTLINQGLDYLQNYNFNPWLSKNTPASTVSCNSIMDFNILPMVTDIYTRVDDNHYIFNSYFPLPTDYTVLLNQNLTPFTPNQGMCYGSSNTNYKNIQVKDDQIIKSYKVYNTIGQLLAKNIGDNSSDIDKFIRKIKSENLFNNGIHLIEIATNKGIVHKKEMF